MPRITEIANIAIQLPSKIQPQQFGAVLLLSQFTVLVDAEGKPTTTPAFSPIPADGDDVSEELLHAINQQLQKIGLFMGRAGSSTAIPSQAPAEALLQAVEG